MKEDLVKLHHARSQKDFPGLNLEDGEYVELVIHRAPIGVTAIWVLAFAVILVLTVSLGLLLTDNNAAATLNINQAAVSYLYFIIFILYGITAVAAFVATRVYRSNRLVVSNNRLFHYQSLSLFSRSTNVIDLSSIEDVSYRQTGLVDHLLHMGTIRLSTVGDETTYTFKYAAIPKANLDEITHLVHVAKKDKKST
ncbi:PH domain-containing protein [Candidatus Saccharibacteria bacterium]|nr:PH domain-containing protein [Candidatus Saccharibacteria bacterium]